MLASAFATVNFQDTSLRLLDHDESHLGVFKHFIETRSDSFPPPPGNFISTHGFGENKDCN